MSDENLYDLGMRKFINFCKTIKSLIKDQGLKFDLIVASGNSGLAMGRYAEMIFKELSVEYPPRLSIPFYRFLSGYRDDRNKKFDSSFFIPNVQKQIADISHTNDVLFVDDEIGLGITALSILDLLNQVLTGQGRPVLRSYYIVAENQGFNIPEEKKEIRFIPYDTETEGYNNVIFFMTPPELEKPIMQVFGDDESLPFHQRVNILLNLPIKDFNNGNPIYTNKYLEMANGKIPNFKELQEKYERYIENLIRLTCG